MKKNLYRRGTTLLLAACLLLSCTACGGGASATAMHLRKTEGTVSVSDDAGKDVEPRENLGLYSGYGVDTSSESYAWIDLDDVKLTKLDQDSEIEIKKEEKHLEIEVLSGSLFFNVTEPLKEDETMEIRSSTMAVGIRGTCGWVEVPDDAHMTLCLLEGKVECTAGDESVTVNAGERATMTADDTITVSALQKTDIPDFVWDEVDDDLMDEAEEAMEEALEVYPLSGFKSFPYYMNESRVPNEIKETVLQIYEAASVGNQEEARRLLRSLSGFEYGELVEYEQSTSRDLYTEYAGYRFRLGETTIKQETTNGTMYLEIRPESGTGFEIGCSTISIDAYYYGTAPCKNYNWNGSFNYFRNDGAGMYQTYTGRMIDSLYEGEIVHSSYGYGGDYTETIIYSNGLREGDTERRGMTGMGDWANWGD